MGKIEQLVKSKLLGNDNPNNLVWPITKTQAVYDKTNTDLQTVLDSLGSEIQEIKEINNVTVRYDQVQELTEEQKETARTNIDAGTYSKPNTGIPKTDLSSDVQASLDKADTALQEHQSLANYYTKSETYTKEEVVTQITNAIKGSFVVVASLPTASADTLGKIYLVPSANAQTQNIKDEYITIENGGVYSWEKIGSTAIDLSGYATEQYVDEEVYAKYTKPASGIPASDLASGVQTSLALAESALQPGQTVEVTQENPYIRITITEDTGTVIISSDNRLLLVQKYGSRDYVAVDLYGTSSAGALLGREQSFYVAGGNTNHVLFRNCTGTVASSPVPAGQFFIEIIQKVTTISNRSTDYQYPSAKAVYDAIPEEATNAEVDALFE